MMPNLLRDWLKSLQVALVLMTTIPVVYPKTISETAQRRSLYCYPLVGVILGFLLWLIYPVSGTASLLDAAILMLAWVVLTGALHLDGLADCADAWMGGIGDREKTLRILKDPVCGAIAVVALVIVLLVKVAAIQQLLKSQGAMYFIAIPLLARTTPILLFWHLPYIRQGGLGASLMTAPSDHKIYWTVVVASALCAFVICGANALWLLIVTAALFLVVAVASKRRLGGFTGDVAGAQIELAECVLCVTAALLL